MKVYQLEFRSKHLCVGGEFRKSSIDLWRSRERAEANQDAFLQALHGRYDGSPFEPEWATGKIEIVELELEDEAA